MKYCVLCDKTYDDDVAVCSVDGAVLRASGFRQDPLVGRVMKGRYRVLRRIGEGGMGTVYLAEQISIGRNVAMKVLQGEFARDDEFVKRFRQEARLAASLNHRNITTIFDFDQADDGSLFIVMEYLEGQLLNELIHQNGALDVHRAVHFGIQIAEGLAAAHRAGVIHRDVKPQNIMVVGSMDEVKLMDFGIARLMNSEVSQLTVAGVMMGTPAYMAPEQIEGQEVSEKTDIYAFGVVLYEMLAGVTPFAAPTRTAILAKHLNDVPAPLSQVRRDVPPELGELVRRALEKDPDSRQDHMEAVVRGLRAVEGQPGEAPAPRMAVVDLTVVATTPAGSPPVRLSPPTPVTHRDSLATVVATPTDVSSPTLAMPDARARPGRGQTNWKLAGASALLVLLAIATALWLALGGAPSLFRRPFGSERPSAALPTASVPAKPVAEEAVKKAPTSASEEADRKGADGVPRDVAARPLEETGRKIGARAPKTEAEKQRNEAPRLPDGALRRQEAEARRRAEPEASRGRLSPEGPAQRPREDRSPDEASRIEEARKRAEAEAARKQAEAEAARKQAETEAARKEAETEAARKQAEAALLTKARENVPPPDPARIRALVEQKLRGKGLLREAGSDSGVTVDISADRVVTLTGVLRDQEQVSEMLQLAREVPGVTEVRPKINVQKSWQFR